MRQTIQQIEMEEKKVTEFTRLAYEAQANSNLFITAIKNNKDNEIKEDMLDILYKKYIESNVALENFKTKYIFSVIPDEYQTDEYKWFVDSGRNCLEIFKQ